MQHSAHGTDAEVSNDSSTDGRKLFFAPNDIGNVERLLHYEGANLCYVDGRGWYVWNGQFWEQSEVRAESLATSVIKSIGGEISGHSHSESLQKWNHRCLTGIVPRMTTMLRLARNERLTPLDTFNQNAQILPVENGTIDLATGSLREHRREDFTTHLCPIEYAPGAKCDRFLRALDEIFDGSEELIPYIQEIYGHCLTGIVLEKAIYYFHGRADAGKTLLVELLRRMLGTFAVKIQNEVFAASSRDTTAGRIAKGRMLGRRLVCASEPEKLDKLRSGLLKEVTGMEIFAGRLNYAPTETEISPTMKIVLTSNHLPIFDGDDSGIVARMRLIRFPHSFSANPESGLGELLWEERSGILNWALEGARRALKNGSLNTPRSVTTATRDAAARMNPIGMWLQKKTVRVPGGRTSGQDLWHAYREWMAEEAPREDDLKELRAFYKAVETNSVEKERGESGIRFRGIALI